MHSILAFRTVVLLSTVLLAGVAADAGTTAVVDRTGDDYAVLLVEEDGETTDQRVVDPAVLDAEGRYEGAVHRAVGGDYVYNEAETRRRHTANSQTYAGNVV